MATTKTITEPAATAGKSSTPAAAKYAVDDAVRILIDALGLKEEDVKGIDVRDRIVRVFGVDNSARGVKIEPLKRYVRDAQGRVVEE